MVDVVLGIQFGDEGKGKIIDNLSIDYNIVARFNGGNNAGHQIHINGIKHTLHLIPSGVFHNHTKNVIGTGCVIDPKSLNNEIENLKPFDKYILNRIFISEKAHLILPTHKELDKLNELLKGDQKIGSTLKGIGPAYVDKIGRNGLRVGDIFTKDFHKKLKEIYNNHKNYILFIKTIKPELSEEIDNIILNLPQNLLDFLTEIEVIKTYNVINTEKFLNEAINDGLKILAEGAQGSMLDIDHGTYPFCTSSNTNVSGVISGLGIAPQKINKVIGISKLYSTRVGNGPFIVELFDEVGEFLATKGNEVGSTTGRKRRCGWLDLVPLKVAVELNGITELCITKADILSGLSEIKICGVYEDKKTGEKVSKIPIDHDEYLPYYFDFDGWDEDISQIDTKEKLPKNLLKIFDFIENSLNVKIKYVGNGPDRKNIIKYNG